MQRELPYFDVLTRTYKLTRKIADARWIAKIELPYRPSLPYPDNNFRKRMTVDPIVLYYFDLRFVNFVDFGLQEGRRFIFRFVVNFKSALFFRL
jgi:hypothetical protein